MEEKKQEIIESSKNFDLMNFFSNESDFRNGVLVITNDQYILCDTLNNGASLHSETQSIIQQIIKNVDMKRYDSAMPEAKKNLEIANEYGFNDIIGTLMNFGGETIFSLDIPENMTQSKLELLNIFNEKYNHILKQLSDYYKKPFIGYRKKTLANDLEFYETDDFNDVVEFAKTMLKSEVDEIRDNEILGVSLEEANKKHI